MLSSQVSRNNLSRLQRQKKVTANICAHGQFGSE
jgi:hypothetical protein